MHVTVTAGPTREAMDPVPLSVQSFYRQNGVCHLPQCEDARGGSHVDFRSGRAKPLDGVRMIPVTSACDMREAVMRLWPQSELVIKAAAVRRLSAGDLSGR